MQQKQTRNKKQKIQKTYKMKLDLRLTDQRKQQKFNNRYCLTDRKPNYDALNDPYTSYYFSNLTVKSHLLTLKRALKQERNFSEKMRLKMLISARIKERYDAFICPKTSVYEKEIRDFSLVDDFKSSFNLNSRKTIAQKSSKILKHSNKIKHRFPSIKKQVTLLESQIFEQPDSKTNQKTSGSETNKEKFIKKQNMETGILRQKQSQSEFSTKLRNELHDKKHMKFLQFLEEKKKILKKFKPQNLSVNNEQKND